MWLYPVIRRFCRDRGGYPATTMVFVPSARSAHDRCRWRGKALGASHRRETIPPALFFVLPPGRGRTFGSRRLRESSAPPGGKSMERFPVACSQSLTAPPASPVRPERAMTPERAKRETIFFDCDDCAQDATCAVRWESQQTAASPQKAEALQWHPCHDPTPPQGL